MRWNRRFALESVGRRTQRFLRMHRRSLSAAIFLLFCVVVAVVRAGTVDLVETVEHRTKFEMLMRRYVATSEGEPPRQIELVAQKLATSPQRYWWSLTFSLPASQQSLPMPGKGELAGPDGLIEQCLKRFMSDVPDANVWSVSADLRVSASLWTDVRVAIVRELDRTDGLRDPKSRKLRREFNNALKDSAAAQELARRVAILLNCTIRGSVHLNSDGLVLEKENQDRPWADLRNNHSLGLDFRWMPMGIFLKPARGPKE